jgi:hypothetical protein
MLSNLLSQASSKLSSTPLLEDKVLRVCLSYGHEVCAVQPEVLTLLDDFKLKKSDLLTLDEAGMIFGGFMIPSEVDQILRESTHDADDNEEYDRYGRTYDMDAESDEDLEMVRQEMLKEKARDEGGGRGVSSQVEQQFMTRAPLKSSRRGGGVATGGGGKKRK